MDQILRARGVHGVILAPMREPGSSLSFPWENYAVATLGRSLAAPLLSHAMVHQSHATDRALRELLERGYERIAFWRIADAEFRTENASLMTFLLHNFQLDPEQRIEPIAEEGMERDRLRHWYERERPDAILSSYSTTFSSLREIGLRIPEDVGFAPLSWRSDYPEVSGVRAPSKGLGASVVDIVVAQIHRNEYGIPARPKTMLVEGEWVEGTTLRARE
jgi:LacI family transcriptional regulator